VIAALGMYDFGPLRAANDRLWRLVRDGLGARGIAAPDALTRGEAAYWPAWQAPDLLLAQTCGYPFRARLHGHVAYVGTPDYGVEGCPPGYYRSVFVARAEDPRQSLRDFDGARFAWNEDLSQSGWAAPQTHAARLGLRLLPAVRTGGHQMSAAAVVEGHADLAALDAVTHALMADHDPVAARLRVVALTDPTPGLPLITAPGGPTAALYDAFAAAVAALAPSDRALLRLRGLIRLRESDYLAVPDPPPPAQIAVQA
jgi:ABC-type phosphate/phosphonate transport system substrate-binding protein